MLSISQLPLYLGILALVYVLIATILYLTQEKFIFFPAKLSPNYSFSQYKNTREVYVTRENGLRLHALFFAVPNPKGIILFFHGNKFAVDEWGSAAADFTALGYEVLMPDYRGYGKSEGKITKGILHEDAMAFYEHLRKDHSPKNIILYGRSLGTGIACQLATKVPAQQLILETPYMSLLAMANLTLPFFPASLLMKYHMRNDIAIKKVKCPVHIFHGTEDELIPYQQAVQLTKIKNNPTILTTIEGGKHSDLTNFEGFQKQLTKLLT